VTVTVQGISLQQLGQPVSEVVGRVSVVTPLTALRARFHPQLETYHDEPLALLQRTVLLDLRLEYIA